MPHHIDLMQLQELLLDAILDGRDAQGIVDNAYAYLQLPIIAFDVEFGLIAYAYPRPFYYAPWEEIAKGHGTVKFLEFLPNQERIFQHGRSLLFEGQEVNEVACVINANGTLVGYVGIIIDDADAQMVLQANDLLASVLSYYFEEAAQYAKTHFKELGFAELFEVLFGRDSALTHVSRFQRYHVPWYVFAVMESDEGSIADLQYIRSAFCRQNNSVVGLVGPGGQLRMLFWGIQPRDLDWITIALQNIGATLGIHCGVSDIFPDLSDLHTHQKQALESLQAGQRYLPGQRLYIYRDCVIAILCAVASDRYGQTLLVPLEIQQLSDMDDKAGSDYIGTLATYLRHRCGATKTAKELGIHNNTLKYRLNKIEDLTGLQLKAPQTVFRLQLGLQIHNLLNADAAME